TRKRKKPIAYGLSCFRLELRCELGSTPQWWCFGTVTSLGLIDVPDSRSLQSLCNTRQWKKVLPKAQSLRETN
ncbi:hypothetical protein U0070_011488, partial [Myodes glareolus]